MSGELGGPLAGTRLTDDYVRTLGRLAYLWGWPMVNMHNRRLVFAQLPGPGLIDGVVPGSSLGSLCMLHDYISPDQKHVACPNQDVVYGAGILSAELGPSVIQVPDFQGRFWVYQGVDQRTESFLRLGAMYDTEPGMYLLALTSWAGEVPAGISATFTYETAVAIVLPRIFQDNTAADRAAIQPLLSQIVMYPLAEYTGQIQTRNWADVPTFPGGGDSSGDEETQFVVPGKFFAEFPTILNEVPPRPGEEALHAWFASLTTAAATDEHGAEVLRQTGVDANQSLISELFQFRNIGIPSAHHWSTQHNGASFGADYLSRTAMDKANIFVNSPNETAYFYQDLDDTGQRLNGAHTYTVTFPADDGLPPVRGFWSLTLYNQHHFFHHNDLRRYSLGTKNNDLHHNPDGSLTLIASAAPPTDPDLHTNWLPAPNDDSCLYLRAYWPEPPVIDGTWTPPAIKRTE